MPTPEERAANIAAAFGSTIYGDRLRLAILDAILAAVEEEREACAQVAEMTAGGHYMARICASVIRARSGGKD